MGACNTKQEYKGVLRNSIFGGLVPESDWDGFCELFKPENFSLSRHINISKSVALYVVVSGEVIATITNSKVSYSTIARTYEPGDVIHMLSSSLVTMEGSISLNSLTITLSPKASSIIRLDWAVLHDFLKTRSHLTVLSTFCSLNVGRLMAKNMLSDELTPKQWELLGPLLHLKFIMRGEELMNEFIAESKTQNLTWQQQIEMFRISNQVVASNQTMDVNSEKSRSKVGGLVLLHGCCVDLLRTKDVSDFKLQLKNQNSSGTSKRRHSNIHRKFQRNRSNSLYLATWHCFNENLSVSHDPRFKDDGEVLVQGALMGLENYFLPPAFATTPVQRLVACEACLVGMLPTQMLEVLRVVDAPFIAELSAHFHYTIITSIHNTVPLLSEMEMTEAERRSLALSVSIHHYDEGDFVYKQGQPGDNLYVVISGSVCELYSGNTARIPTTRKTLTVKPSSVAAAGPEDSSESSVSWASRRDGKQDVSLTHGQYFGEVALVTESPYSCSVRVVEPSVLLLISYATFTRICDHSKANMCEMKVRLMGTSVDMQHVLDHPKGYALTMKFLEKEHAAENIEFWHGVDRFHEMCDLFKKHVELDSAAQRLHSLLSQTGNPQLFRNRSKQNMDTDLATIHEVHSFRSSSVSSHISGRSSLRKAMSNKSLDAGLASPGSSSKGGDYCATFDISISNSGAIDAALRDLLAVASSLMEKYVAANAAYQINISGEMRKDTEKMYATWAKHVSMFVCHNNTHHSTSDSSILMEQILVPSKEIFRRPKTEVFEILKRDTFVRLKETPEFQAFLADIKPLQKEGKKNAFANAACSEKLCDFEATTTPSSSKGPGIRKSFSLNLTKWSAGL